MFPLKILMLKTRFNFPSRGQKLSADLLLSDSAAQVSSFRSAEIISTAPTVNLVFVFQSSVALPAKDKQTIRSEFSRKSFLKNF